MPENLDVKKRRLLYSMQKGDSLASSSDTSNPQTQAVNATIPLLCTSPSTPTVAPCYHYSSKNVDTTHIILRNQIHYRADSFDRVDELLEHTHALLESDDDEEQQLNLNYALSSHHNHTSVPISSNGSFSVSNEKKEKADKSNIFIASNQHPATATHTEECQLTIQSRSTIQSKMVGTTSQDPPNGKVGIQIVKQINTQYIFEKFKDANIRNPIMSPGSIELHWDRKPERVLVVKQMHTDRTDKAFEKIVKYLVNEKKATVYVEPLVFEKLKWPFLHTFADNIMDSNVNAAGENHLNRCNSQNQSINNQEIASNSSSEHNAYKNLHRLIDLIICLGGDGTILHTASLFPSAVPPILGFNMGSLGFLTSFDINRYKEYINHVFNGSVYLSTRMRLTCKIRRSNGTIEPMRYQVLNELVVERGPSPFLCNLECFCNNTQITTVQADGLILATPTGSTAYSMSAGGSIVHPNVNCLLLTPICPHSLSFRPIILPDSTILTIKVPRESRSTAWISFDGKCRQELQRGDSVIVTTSIWPVPLISKTEETSEWFKNLTDIFNWNRRERQKSFNSEDFDSEAEM